jgi:hypothetical protein
MMGAVTRGGVGVEWSQNSPKAIPCRLGPVHVLRLVGMYSSIAAKPGDMQQLKPLWRRPVPVLADQGKNELGYNWATTGLHLGYT